MLEPDWPEWPGEWSSRPQSVRSPVPSPPRSRSGRLLQPRLSPPEPSGVYLGRLRTDLSWCRVLPLTIPSLNCPPTCEADSISYCHNIFSINRPILEARGRGLWGKNYPAEQPDAIHRVFGDLYDGPVF